MILKEHDHGTPAPAGPTREPLPATVTLTIDGHTVSVAEGTSVMTLK